MVSQSTHEDKDFVHIAMELCAGGELFDSIVEAGSFSERKAAVVFRKMVEVSLCVTDQRLVQASLSWGDGKAEGRLGTRAESARSIGAQPIFAAEYAHPHLLRWCPPAGRQPLPRAGCHAS